VNPNSTKALKVSVSSSKYSLSNQQVWLNESGVTSATGSSYLFSALIGSVLNQGIQLGALQNTKSDQGSGSYAFPRSLYTTNSPVASPYTGVGSVPLSQSVTSGNGGGVSFSSFTSASNDNLLQITSSQFSSLSTNWGPYGETESLFITGFPVYDQQSSVNNFALQGTGGAYMVIFNKPISNSLSSGATQINAPIRILGTNYTIINESGMSASPGGTSKYEVGGQMFLAASATPLQTVYVGHNLTSGPWTVQLQDLAQTNNGLNAPAAVAVYYNGQATNESSVLSGTTAKFNVSGHLLYLNVNSTFAGLYAYQKWAKLQLYTSVYKVVSGQSLNTTTNGGWNDELLWTNTTSASGIGKALYGIILYNTTTSVLTPGQSFSFIQNPSVYKLTFVGDTLGNNFDSVSVATSSVSSVQYANANTITNITEPAQELTVTSQIPNAFSYAGQTGSQVVYDLTPYVFNQVTSGPASLTWGGGASGTGSAGAVTNVIMTYVDPSHASGSPTPWIANSPVGVTISGYSFSNTIQTQSVTFYQNASTAFTTTNGQILGTALKNVTAIQITSRALPIFPTTGSFTLNVVTYNGLTPSNSLSLGTLASTAPVILYSQSGKSYLATSSSTASTNYNQQNGQPIANVVLATAGAVTAGNGNHELFTIQVGEVSVPSNTMALDYLGAGIYNNTATASPSFVLNYSTSGQHNNVTYTSTQGQSVNAQTGFRTEKGSKVASISASQDTFQMATAIDQLQFALTRTASNTVVSKAYKTFGPYSVGQATNLPNVTIGMVNATPVLSGSSTYTILGESNLTATPSVTQATTPVWLKNLSSTSPLVVLDSSISSANQASSLILVGSGYVNSLSATLESAYNLTSQISPSESQPIVAAYGNKILIAGYTADQTLSGANSFISQLYAQAATG
jgi:hypothetical protein